MFNETSNNQRYHKVNIISLRFEAGNAFMNSIVLDGSSNSKSKLITSCTTTTTTIRTAAREMSRFSTLETVIMRWRTTCSTTVSTTCTSTICGTGTTSKSTWLGTSWS